MQVNQVSSQSFGNLFTTKYVDRLARTNRTYASELKRIKNILQGNKLDSLEYVDIILHHSKEMNGFYGVISSKKQGVPNDIGYRCKISFSAEDINEFGNWARAWNNLYSSKTIQTLDILQNAVINFIRHNN